MKKLIVAAAALSFSALGAAAQQGGQLTLRDTHGAWEVRCATDNPAVCLMIQDGKNANGETVVKMGLRNPKGAKTPDGKPIAAVVTIEAPLGVALIPGAMMKIDGREVGRAPFSFCNAAACVVNMPVGADLIDMMKKGSQTVVTIAGLNGQTADANISLSGFTKAYNGL